MATVDSAALGRCVAQIKTKLAAAEREYGRRIIVVAVRHEVDEHRFRVCATGVTGQTFTGETYLADGD